MENQLRIIKVRQEMIDMILHAADDASFVLIVEDAKGLGHYRHNAPITTALGMCVKTSRRLSSENEDG